MRSTVDRRSFALMLAAGAVCCGRTAAAAPSPWLADAFRDEVIAVGRRHFPGMPFAPGRGTVLSGDHTLYLRNIYAMVEGLPPAEREAAIAEWLSHFTPAADTRAEALKKATDRWEEARPLLRPRLMNHAASRTMPQIIRESFSPGLNLAFAIDLGDKDLYVSDEKFAHWKVPQAEVRAAAIGNLERMSAAMTVDATSLGGTPGRCALVDSGDGYDAARIVLPAFRKTLLAALGPSFIAALPARDLLICWTLDFGRQDAMVRVVEEDVASLPHALTSEMFFVSDGGVVPMRAMFTR